MSAAPDPALNGAYGPVRRKEDARFLRGQGTFVDDIQRPGMLHGAILRSPLAHARIVSVDTTAALAHPRVRAVITGEMLQQRKLAWMPTLSRDVQAVLATDKVRFQGQEVAAVIAEDPYVAEDALELIDVDYDMLPAVVDPVRALDEAAPLIRDDKDGQTDNVCYTWEVGDKAMTDRAFERAERVVKLDCFYPRSHPSPIECCGCIADYNPATAKLTLYMTTQAPHIIRTAVALVAEL
ncbi:MAG TPA: molybdopterin cofactor-binding domain-containing protein, partial [Streptosporangiaceae bacterium]